MRSRGNKRMKIDKVQEDKRGEIWKIETGKRTAFLSKTFKGKARGGDIHDGSQYTLILEGKVKVLMKFPEREKEEILEKNDLIIVPKDIPHVFIALEDSVFLEWHELPLPEYSKKRFFEPYRKLCK